MSLDITVYKVNKKEWNNYAKDRDVDYFEALNHTGKSGGVSYVGEAKDFPALTFLGYFYGVRGFTYFEEVIDCVFTEFTRDMLREVDEWVKEKEDCLDDVHKTFFHAWYVAVVNSLQEDETILVVCDW